MRRVQVSPRFKAIGVPYDDAVHNLFPDAKVLQLAGVDHLLLPHKPTETFMLRKMGFDVPAPILTHYEWAGAKKPFASQKSTAALLSLEPRCYVLNGMGTGKTSSTLWAWDYLRTHGAAGKLLVSAPLSTLNFTWMREIFSTLPHRKAVVLHGSKAKRLEALQDPDAEIFIINHDGHKVILGDLIVRTDIDTLAIDELAVFRNGSSSRTKEMKKLAVRMARVWGLTGSPIPNSPTDAWAQASIVRPDSVPRYFGRYREDLMVKHGPFKWTPKPDAVEKAFNTLQPAVRFTLDDVVELPDLIERTQDVDLGPKQARVYKALVEQAHASIASKEITAANAGAVMMKLLQVSGGWVYTATGDVVPLDNDKRIDALMNAVTASENKVLVFVNFKHALAGISEALTKEGIEHAIVSGDTPASERATTFNLFQNSNKYRVLLAHPQCLAHGITLTSADTIVWFGPVTSLETYEQANARIRRVGQKNKQLILHLQSTPVERRIYKMLQTKQKVQDKLLQLFEDDTRVTAENAS